MTTRKHTPLGKTPSMRVTYDTGIGQSVSEWICFDHGHFAARKAIKWAEARGQHWMSVDEALAIDWPMPKRIKVQQRDSKYFTIIDYDWEGKGNDEEAGKEKEVRIKQAVCQ